MGVFARALPLRANRRANIIAAIVTGTAGTARSAIAFVVGGGSLTTHSLFFASVEVAALLVISWTARTWREAARHACAVLSDYAG